MESLRALDDDMLPLHLSDERIAMVICAELDAEPAIEGLEAALYLPVRRFDVKVDVAAGAFLPLGVRAEEEGEGDSPVFPDLRMNWMQRRRGEKKKERLRTAGIS